MWRITRTHTYKHRSSEANAVHVPLSPGAWECTLSSLSLRWRLQCVDQAPACGGWDVSSFLREAGRKMDARGGEADSRIASLIYEVGD